VTSGPKGRGILPPKKGAAAGAAAGSAGGPREDPAVEEMLRTTDHPLREEIGEVRRLLLDADPSIREGVKWNAPSFRTTEWFATLNNPGNPRARDRVMLVLHAGAKAKGIATKGKVPDPEGLLRWLGEDRALVTFTDRRDIRAKRVALQAVVREWIRRL
jgi:hypothetical protein